MSWDNDDIEKEFDLEFWLDRESREHKIGHGSSGTQINCKECPACGDTRWRTYLNQETGRGNCFVCNMTYNKVKFVHIALGGDPGDKSSWRATFEHIRGCMSEQGWKPRRKTAVAVETPEAVMPPSFALPTKDGQNLVYLENRGFNGEIAKYFHLRYCIEGEHKFIRPDGSRGWQKFDGRIIIPVYDLDGKFVTFQGRDVTGEAVDKKYLFPSGLPGTGRYLFNGQSAVRAPRVALGEGAFDVAAMKIAFDGESDLRDVVPIGSFGKHLSYGSTTGDDQLTRFRELKKYGLQEVVIMWDGEWKALVSAIDAAQLLVQLGLKVRIALLPRDKDPNEVTPDVVRKAFWEAVPYSKALAVRWRLFDPYAKA